MDYNVITILGPTATGKTRLAVQIADYFNGEIISADSRQVYKGMNLGTGKDYDDYIINNNKIPCYMIDLIESHEEFNAYLFKELFNKAFSEITEKVKLPIICGGTGLYLSAVIQNYKLNQKDIHSRKELEKLSFDELKSLFLILNKSPHNTTDLVDRNRIITALMILQSENESYTDTSDIKSFTIGINPGREEIKKKISYRLKIRLESGMIEEVKLLMEHGISHERMLYFGLEYKYIAFYLAGKLSYNDMFQKLNTAIHSFAKRQMTWFRKMEKEGIRINWIESNNFIRAKTLIESAGFRST
jgi:tRNA dimethylallyltransferase